MAGGSGRLRWLRNDKETKVEGYRQKYTKPCGRQGEARVRFEDLDVLFDRHVRRRRLFVKCFANPFHEERWLFREREKKTKRSRYPYGSLHARSCCFRNWRCEAYINTNERAIVSTEGKGYVFSRTRGGGNNNDDGNIVWKSSSKFYRRIFVVQFFVPVLPFFFFTSNLAIFLPLILDFHIVNFLYYVNVTSYVNLFILAFLVYIYIYIFYII